MRTPAAQRSGAGIPDGAEFSGFGRAVAATGSWAFIAAPAWDGDGGGAANLGAVHAYGLLECPAP